MVTKSIGKTINNYPESWLPIVLDRSSFHISLGFDRFGSGLPEQENDEDGYGEGDQAARHTDEHLLRGEA